MQKIDLKKFSVQELNTLKLAIQKELTDRKQQQSKEQKLLAKFQKMADAEGVPLESLLSSKKKQKVRGKKVLRGKKVAPKYKNPDQPSEKWAGRGRKPGWVQAWLDKGGTLEDLLIK